MTKSITSSMLGISIRQGKLASLDQAIAPFFPGQITADANAKKKAITLRNLVDMRSGIAWKEWPYNEQSSIYRMIASKNWNQFLLEQPMDSTPGEVFNYNGGNMNLLSAIVEQSWGKPMEDVAKQELFGPLGIAASYWAKDPQGHTLGESSLGLDPYGMARLGQFWLDDGIWQGRRLLPIGWTAQLQQDSLLLKGQAYSRAFWLDRDRALFAAMGRHGQWIVVEPSNQLVTVITAKAPDTGAQQQASEAFRQALKEAIKPNKALPANAQAHAELTDIVHRLAIAPVGVKNTLEQGKSWYGKTWRLDANPLGITAIGLKTNEQDQGALVWEVDFPGGKNSWPLGLDGAYRFKPDSSFGNLNLALRGKWLDAATLELNTQYSEFSNVWHYKLHFAKESVEIEFFDNEASSAKMTGHLVADNE